MKATIFHVLRNGLIPCLRSPVSIRPLSALLVPLLLASCVQNTVPKDVKHPQLRQKSRNSNWPITCLRIVRISGKPEPRFNE